MVDGRHRVEGYGLNGIEEGLADIVEVANEVQLISAAYVSNLGGSLPPKPADTEHTVELLIQHGETIKNIADLLSLPPAMARKYVSSVKSRLARAKLVEAAAAVTDGGLTVNKAAEQFDVKADKLKQFLQPGRGSKSKQNIVDTQRRLTAQYRSNSSKNAAMLKNMMEKLEDGDVTAKQVREIFDHLESLQKKGTRAIIDWRRRFEAKLGSNAA